MAAAKAVRLVDTKEDLLAESTGDTRAARMAACSAVMTVLQKADVKDQPMVGLMVDVTVDYSVNVTVGVLEWLMAAVMAAMTVDH